MSTLKAAKFPSIITLMAILLMLATGVAQAGEKGGYLGVMLQDINTSMAKAMDLDDENGVLINEVVSGSPADEAGLQDGDVIIKFNGKELANHKALTKAVSSSAPGEKVEVVVLRDGKKKTLNVELGEREENTMVFYSDDGDVHFPHLNEDVFVWQDDSHGHNEQIKIMIKDLEGMGGDRGFMGVQVEDINEQMGDYFDVKDGEGALVTSVTEDSAAENAGLKAGDVIVKISDEDIESAGDVHKALAGTEPEQKLSIEVIRKGKKKQMDITLGELPEDQMTRHIEMIGGDHNVYMRSPKSLHHGMSAPHQMHKQLKVIYEDEKELKEMREELDKMKMELKEMQKELKK